MQAAARRARRQLHRQRLFVSCSSPADIISFRAYSLLPSTIWLRRSTRAPARRHTLSPPPPPRCTMATSSDDAYLSFLNKANQDLDAGRAQAASTTTPAGQARTETLSMGVLIPAPLQSLDAWYTSETDEPFEPVVLRWEDASKGIWPGPLQMSMLISPDRDLSSAIETMSVDTFDPNGRYAPTVRAVRAAAAQDSVDEQAVDVKVYRIETGSSTAEYWVLALETGQGQLVGVRAKAVES